MPPPPWPTPTPLSDVDSAAVDFPLDGDGAEAGEAAAGEDVAPTAGAAHTTTEDGTTDALAGAVVPGTETEAGAGALAAAADSSAKRHIKAGEQAVAVSV